MNSQIYPGQPVGGIDYPRTMQEFDEWFPDETACATYLFRLRWPKGFICPACGINKGWLTARRQIRCAGCQRQTSITAGTIFEGTRKPLRMWFLAVWYVTSQKFGGNALGLQRILGLGSYQTAWSWLHKLRRAMVVPGRDLLHGHIEVDETYVGGEEEGLSGRQIERKAIVVVAVEVFEPKGFGRIRLQQIPDVSKNSLVGFIRQVISPGSVILTDGWKGYAGLGVHGYTHDKIVLSDSGDPAHVALPGVHRVASLLKRWLLGTHQGAVSKKHLGYYLDEYTFRFNRRKSKARGLLFYRLLQNAVQVGPASYRQLTAGEQDRGRRSKKN
ncbi:IS1595 family transposase [Thermodesulfobacteriota bacterium B35]